MNVQQFRSRFLLHSAYDTPMPATTTLHQAAVLVPLIDYGDQLHVLFTRRALHLRHHPGQISFPGGRIEAGENSAAAALREAHEEIGLAPDQVQLLGTLPLQHTSTGFSIVPWVGLMAPQRQWQLQASEVAAVFEVPLGHFLDQQNRHQLSVPVHGQQHQLHVMPYQDKFIWGATAAILHRLCQHLV